MTIQLVWAEKQLETTQINTDIMSKLLLLGPLQITDVIGAYTKESDLYSYLFFFLY